VSPRGVAALRAAVGLVAAAVAIARLAALDATSNSASDTLRPWALELAVIALVAAIALAIVGRMRGHPGS
jgi:hypothetical protein